MNTTFSERVRSERHFSSFLLPHLLLANDYGGMRALFRSVDLFKEVDLDSDDIEIVAEINPIRDVGDKSDRKRKQSVPDLFLRIGKNVLVIEAKFFTFPTGELIVEQIRTQREAIERVRPRTNYGDYDFHYLALTIHRPNDFPMTEKCMSHMTWDQVIEVIEPAVNAAESLATSRMLKVLSHAVKRANKKLKKKGVIRYKHCKTIQELLSRASEFLENGYLYIGFDGGISALHDSTVSELEGRPHFKYSFEQWSDNWLPIHEVVSHYLEKKAEDSERRVNT